jgi:hypothetical protein
MLIPIVAVAASVSAIVAVASRRPDTFHYSRSVVIAASADRAFAHVANFRAWTAWSPYEEYDRAMKKSYSGEDGALGSGYAWEGNGKVGAGTMRIEAMEAPSRVEIALAFDRPFKANNVAEFLFEATSEGTKVTWSMRGKNPFLSKMMGLFVDMDKLVASDFQRGLNALKALVEAS